MLRKEIVGVVLIVFELLSDGSWKDFDKKKELPHLVGLYNNSLVLKCFHSFPKGTIGYATIVKKVFNKVINSGFIWAF